MKYFTIYVQKVRPLHWHTLAVKPTSPLTNKLSSNTPQRLHQKRIPDTSNVFIVLAFGSQKPQFLGKFWYLGVSCTDPLLPTTAKFGAPEQTHSVRLRAKFRLDRFILSLSGGEKPQFLDLGI